MADFAVRKIRHTNRRRTVYRSAPIKLLNFSIKQIMHTYQERVLVQSFLFDGYLEVGCFLQHLLEFRPFLLVCLMFRELEVVEINTRQMSFSLDTFQPSGLVHSVTKSANASSVASFTSLLYLAIRSSSVSFLVSSLLLIMLLLLLLLLLSLSLSLFCLFVSLIGFANNLTEPLT